MTYIFRLTLSLLCLHLSFLGIAQAQDLMPPKSPESGELKPAPAGTFPDLHLTPDKPEILNLERDVANIIVGNTDHLTVTPDSARRLVLIPRRPGTTFMRILDESGAPIMERHVIIGAPKKKDNYVRIRRSCINGEEGCQEYSMYYCPDMCHKLGLVEEDTPAPQHATEITSSGDPQAIPIGSADPSATLTVQ